MFKVIVLEISISSRSNSRGRNQWWIMWMLFTSTSKIYSMNKVCTIMKFILCSLSLCHGYECDYNISYFNLSIRLVPPFLHFLSNQWLTTILHTPKIIKKKKMIKPQTLSPLKSKCWWVMMRRSTIAICKINIDRNWSEWGQ